MQKKSLTISHAAWKCHSCMIDHARWILMESLLHVLLLTSAGMAGWPPSTYLKDWTPHGGTGVPLRNLCNLMSPNGRKKKDTIPDYGTQFYSFKPQNYVDKKGPFITNSVGLMNGQYSQKLYILKGILISNKQLLLYIQNV